MNRHGSQTVRTLIGIALLSSCALVGACTTSSDATITVLGEDSSNLQAMRALAPSFERLMGNEKRPVKVVFEAASFEDAAERANQDFRSGGAKYDIVLQYNFSLAEYASNNYVLRADELARLTSDGSLQQVEASLFQNVWREVGYYYSDDRVPTKGVQAVGYPFAANTMLLVYNKRLFDDDRNKQRFRERHKRELRVPETWQEFRVLAEFFTQPTDGTCGVALQGKSGGWLYYEWVNVLSGFGGAVMKKDHGWEGGPGDELGITSAAAEQAASFYASLKPYACGDFFSMDAPAQRELMLGGRVAMGIMWSDYLYDLAQRAPSKGVTFGFAPVPGAKSLIGGGSYYVNRRSKHPDLAARFIAFLLEPTNQAALAKQGLCSPVRSVYADVSVTDSIPYAQSLAASLARSTYMLEAGPDADLISSRLSEALQKIWQGSPPAGVLRETQDSLRKERAELFARRAAGRS